MSKRPKSRPRRAQALENPAAHFLTVAWMLMVMTTLVCELLSGASHLYVIEVNRQATLMETLSWLLLFAAFVIGFFSLIVFPVVIKARREVPPRPIVAFALLVGAAPIVVIALQALR